MTIIEDGGGSGKTVAIDNDNRIQTASVFNTTEFHANSNNQKAWSVSFENPANSVNNGYFFYLKNTGTKNLIWNSIIVQPSSDVFVLIWRVTGAPTFVASTDVTPVNKFLGSKNTMDATVKVSTNITGLTQDGFLFYMRPDSTDPSTNITDIDIIITPGEQIGFVGGNNVVLKGTLGIIEEF